MTTTEMNDTRRILDMLSQGKITVDEADRLIATLGAAPAASAADTAEAASGEKPKARWIRINVHKPANDHRDAKDINIRVPVAVMRGGMRLGALIGTFAGEKAARRMRARGIDLDLSKINGDLSQLNGPEFDQFLKSLDDVNIDIDDGKSQVRITCE
jgi:hypothetical protein